MHRNFQDLSKYYSIFFHLNVNLLISARSVLLKYRHLAGFCVFSLTRKLNANCLKRILRVGILVQNLSRCKLMRPRWEWRSYENWYVLTFGLVIRERFKVFKVFKDSSATFLHSHLLSLLNPSIQAIPIIANAKQYNKPMVSVRKSHVQQQLVQIKCAECFKRL